ncbi:hypothetical protein [Rhodococcus sp. NPDC006774]|uniref:hypothetical protein n=1 Tax=Rhodococcus sp. NPDC006774 TaxID=3157186 RepID=UPI0033F46B05
MHGEKYFVSANSTASVTSPAIELIWDNARRAHFIDAPSRMQSIFATASLADAQQFRDAHGPASPIFEVDATEAFRADMNLLHNHTSALATSYLAQLYWSQKPGSPNPFWEYLLRPPVRVGMRVLQRQTW